MDCVFILLEYKTKSSWTKVVTREWVEGVDVQPYCLCGRGSEFYICPKLPSPLTPLDSHVLTPNFSYSELNFMYHNEHVRRRRIKQIEISKHMHHTHGGFSFKTNLKTRSRSTKFVVDFANEYLCALDTLRICLWM